LYFEETNGDDGGCEEVYQVDDCTGCEPEMMGNVEGVEDGDRGGGK